MIDQHRYEEFLRKGPIPEDEVNDAIASYLQSQGYQILVQNKGHKQGKDIVARKNEQELWITVKGYPKGTEKTNPQTQATHYFKDAIFDVVAWKNESSTTKVAVALPNRPVYRSLASKTKWLQVQANFKFLWFDNQTGRVNWESGS
ncbi:MAG: hypothetical protein HY680_09385 [Chloroflexi bacterium]|nr:hypothetical protein [Chloroflexota bacterium]